jgi:hypothetical protein
MQLEPVEDQSVQEEESGSSPMIPGGWWIGEVLDSWAHVGVMKISIPGSVPIPGLSVSSQGRYIIGARDMGVFSPGTQVFCYREPEWRYALVLGSVPWLTTNAKRNGIPDWVVPGAMAGLAEDRVHSEVFDLFGKASGLVNAAGGRPCDNIPGDFGALNELGVGYVVGKLCAQIRASHFCGVQAHFLDNLLRILGYNYELFTSGEERRALNDEGEYTDVRKVTMYPWESTGVIATTDGIPPTWTIDGDPEWRKGNNQAAREPAYDDQMGFFRMLEMDGYLGDLQRKWVSGPPAETVDFERLSNNTVYRGLFEQGIGIDGRFTMRSAKGIIFEKTCAIPIPKQTHVPEDPEGDTAENYKTASLWGDGDDHNKDELELTDEVPGMRSSLAYEMHAHLFHLQNVVPLYYHKKDWFLPEEEDAIASMGMTQSIHTDTTGATQFWMDLPDVKEIQIDHRLVAKYYQSRAVFAINDDGSILLEDGYGSQIRMEGGHIFLSARNDVFVQPGRNLVAWAPRDAVIRAGNSVDITAAKTDVRIKAQNNLHMVSVDRGVLIESQSTASQSDWDKVGEDIVSYGVVLKASDSYVASYAKETYIRAGLEDTASGRIHIDSGKAEGELTLQGSQIDARVKNSFNIIMNTSGEEVAEDTVASASFGRREIVIGGDDMQRIILGAANVTQTSKSASSNATSFVVEGNIWAKEGILAEGNALIGGTVWSNGAGVFGKQIHCDGMLCSGVLQADGIVQDDRNGPFVGTRGKDDAGLRIRERKPPPVLEESFNILDRVIQQSLTAIHTRNGIDATRVNRLIGQLYLGDAAWPSDSDVLEKVFFTFRTAEQYITDVDFKMFETRWQQFARASGSVTTWDEPELERPDGTITRPHPGHEVWENGEALGIISDTDSTFVDYSTGLATPRDDMKDAVLSAINYQKLKDAYLVTVQTLGDTSNE